MTTLPAFHCLNSSLSLQPHPHRHLPLPLPLPCQLLPRISPLPLRLNLPANGSLCRGWPAHRPGAHMGAAVGRIMAVAEEATQILESSTAEQGTTSSDQAFSVPVSPSDKLAMYFLAEGTIEEKAIPTVTKALEGTDGISDLQLGVSEGIASIKLTKQTTIQATGVASGLVEIIQGSGFKLQTLSLSFDDDE